MTTNLLCKTWTDLDSSELKLLLDARIGGPGQFDGCDHNPNQFYLPLAREACRIALTYAGSKIVTKKPGPAFDPAEWERVSEEIEKSILTGSVKVGREYSFCSFRVVGSWRGDRSGVQILPPPDDAPRAEIEMAEHPFIFEFPIQVSDFSPVTNHRRLRGATPPPAPPSGVATATPSGPHHLGDSSTDVSRHQPRAGVVVLRIKVCPIPD